MTTIHEYHKIDGLYKREEETKRLMPGVFRNPVVDYLRNNLWMFTEKIDGTNIRVIWDGHRVEFRGRTDRASIQTPLLDRLNILFGGEANEQVFEEHFGAKQVILFGEGYGGKIQNGSNYRKDTDFILFDVEIEGVMLERDNVEKVASCFGIDVVPIILIGTLKDAEDFVRTRPSSTIGTAKMEGVVGHPVAELYNRFGARTIVKIKVRDYNEIDSYT